MQRIETLGGLTCRIEQQMDDDATPGLVVILCHGFGAPGTDLVGLGPELLGASPAIAESVQFIFPEAPLSLDEYGMFGGRAWWPLDVAQLQAAIQNGTFRDLRNDHPEGLPEAREMLMALIAEVRERTGLPMSRIVLGGFSQGSMLTTDVSLRLEEPPGQLCIWSGTLLSEDEWRGLAAKRGPLNVLQSHGQHDPILPFEAATWLRDMFEESGFNVDFIEFPGIHTIPHPALLAFAQILDRMATESV